MSLQRILFICMCLLPIYLGAQNISGTITDITGLPLINANVIWVGTGQGVSTNVDGYFEIEDINPADRRLAFSYIGFKSDTINVGDITNWQLQMIEDYTLVEVDITAKKQATGFLNEAAKIETIGTRELERAACCSLAGCFNTEASVESRTTNVVNNAKELQLLGVSGVYNQVLIDGLPLVQGASYSYITGSVPGPMIQQIFIAKGANSVLQGFESVSGQINIIPKKTEETPMLFLNGFANSFGETNLNVNYKAQKNNWSNYAVAHLATPSINRDINDDDFMDFPRTTRFMFYDKWNYLHPAQKFQTEIAARYWNEERIGGQVDFNKATDKGTQNSYGQTVDINHLDMYSRNEFVLTEDLSLHAEFSGFVHDQQSFFGLTEYNADQLNAYANVFTDWFFAANDHNLKTGVSLRYNQLDELINTNGSRNFDGLYELNYVVPGVFSEASWKLNKWTVNTGLRADYFGDEGLKFTPRFLLRYAVTDQLDFRASAGKAYRIATPFAERTNILASARDVLIPEAFQLEEAINTGANVLYRYFINDIAGSLTADFYHTNFQNQIFPDYEFDPNAILLTNYRGTSISNTFQIENKWTFTEQIELKYAYNFQDVYHIIEDERQTLPFTARHRFMVNSSYTSINEAWQLDATYRWVGERPLPSTINFPSQYQREAFSEPFGVLDFQLTKRWEKFQVYFGVENIFDFRQNDPILAADDPFGPYFDTAFNWGPTRGREFYVGFRYSYNKDKK